MRRTLTAACGVIVAGLLAFPAQAASTTGPAMGPTAKSGSSACKIAPGRNITPGYIAAGFPRSPMRMKASGKVRIPVIFVDFPDARAAESTPSTLWDELSPAQEFFRAVSYGRMEATFEPVLTWVHMSKKTGAYDITRASISSDAQRRYLQEAVNAVDSKVNFRGVTGVLVVAAKEATGIEYSPAFVATYPGYGIKTKEGTITSGATLGNDTWTSWGWKVIPHEMGHALGLIDLYDLYYKNWSDLFRFTGAWDLMGNITGAMPEYMAWNRWLLGWLSDNQVTCITKPAGQTVRLRAIEEPDGMKAVVVRINSTTALVVESRRHLGYDDPDSTSIAEDGALVYVVDTTKDTGTGAIRVIPQESGPWGDFLAKAPVGLNESVTYAGVKITVTARDADSDTVVISR